MTFDLRAMTLTERMYSYAQSSQISGQTGLIGYLRADMDSSGKGFFSTWFDSRRELKTDEFKTELDDVINACRFDKAYCGILGNRDVMGYYCRNHPEAGFKGNYTTEYGFRIDTEKYAYILRLNPTKGDYNAYIYCYQREWLDRHLHNAEKGIRFITPNYVEKFRIPDGDKIRITYDNGRTQDYTCRYIDDYHIEVGTNLYHICEFAERMQQSGNTVIPIRSSLPDVCYCTLSTSKEIVVLKRGDSGHYKTDIPTANKGEAKMIAAENNAKLGVTKAQEAAMLAGSMFGWDTPAADPKSYDENGTPIPPKPNRTDRGRDR